MSNLKNILNSFETKTELDKKVWDKNGNQYTLKKNIREKLLQTAYEFYDSLGVDVIISDITFTGSLANFNWSDFSDIDLHLIADYNQFSENDLPLYKELFLLKKTIFNDKHDITILNYEVELYVQDENEEHTSTGVYSVLNNEWIVEPKKGKETIDKKFIQTKSKQWMDIIDGVIENISDEPLEDAKSLIKKYKEKIKKYRTCGLEKGGEYSIENLVFKVLRRNGYIEKLYDAANKLVDKRLSIKETKIENPDLDKNEKADKIEPDIDKFYDLLNNISSKIYQEPESNMNVKKDVQAIQIALSMLGYELPKFGVDGKFGKETAKSVDEFKKDNNLSLTESILRLFESYGDDTYGFPEGNVDSGKVFRGGEGGNWGGSMGRVLEILSFAKDCKGDGKVVSSQKRTRVKTANGRVSDHYVGNLGAYAVDIPANGKDGDELLACIMEKWDGGSNKDYKGGRWLNVKIDEYRYQFGWRVKNHYDHIHVGVKKIGSKVVTIDKSSSEKEESDIKEKSFVTPEMTDKLVDKLKEKGVTSEDLANYTKEELKYTDEDIKI